MPENAREPSGAQSVERALLLLRVVCTRGHMGWRLSDLAQHCGLGVSTTHRLLAALVRERLVRQRASDRHYVLGPMLFELGFARPRAHADFLEAGKHALGRIHRKTGVMSYLMLRSGTDLVCAARAGLPAQQAFSIEVGARRPLFSGAHGIAMLIAMPEEERRCVLECNLFEVKRLGSRWVRGLERVLAESQRQGFGVHRGEIVPGVHALAVAVPGAGGGPFASLSVLGPAEALTAARTKPVVALLREEAERLAAEALMLDLQF